MKKLLPLALLAFALMPAMAAPPPIPAPKVVVLDRVAILQASKVGRDIARQLQALNTQTKTNFEAQQKSLAADQRQKKEDAFNAKVQGVEEAVQRRAAQIQQASQVSSQVVAQALGPIVEAIVKERGANLVLDKQAVIYSSSSAFDITPDAVARLDAKMPSYKVVLGAKAPAAPQK